MATENEIIKAMTVLAAAYPNFKLTEDTVKIYIRLLSDLDFDLLKASTLHCATMNKFFPSVAEIRESAVELQRIAAQIPSEAEAWGEVVKQLRDVGGYGSPKFSTALIEKTIRDIGGWMSLCASDNNVADRSRFMDAYSKALKEQTRLQKMLPEVRDIVEHKLNVVKQFDFLLTSKLEG